MGALFALSLGAALVLLPPDSPCAGAVSSLPGPFAGALFCAVSICYDETLYSHMMV